MLGSLATSTCEVADYVGEPGSAAAVASAGGRVTAGPIHRPAQREPKVPPQDQQIVAQVPFPALAEVPVTRAGARARLICARLLASWSVAGQRVFRCCRRVLGGRKAGTTQSKAPSPGVALVDEAAS